MNRSLLMLISLALGLSGVAHAGGSVHVNAVGGTYCHGAYSGVHYAGHAYYPGRSYSLYGYGYGLGYGGGYTIGYDVSDIDTEPSGPYYPVLEQSVYPAAATLPVYPSVANTATPSQPVYPAVANSPATTQPRVTPTTATAITVAPKLPLNQIPYGFDLGTKLVKSPWSGFVFNGATKAPEQVVYDANTGQPFRIPVLQ